MTDTTVAQPATAKPPSWLAKLLEEAPPPPPAVRAPLTYAIGKMPPALDYDDGKLPLAMAAQLAHINPAFLDDPWTIAKITAVGFVVVFTAIGLVLAYG